MTSDTGVTSGPSEPARVGIIMGSDSDLPVMQAAADILGELGIAFEMTIVSAHRTPKRLYDYAESAVDRGLRVIIAGAGGAAHLPGMAAAITPLPVIGVPVKTAALSGQDSLLSIVQMPAGVPVATVAIDGAKNAGLLAAQILGASDAEVRGRIVRFKQGLEAMVMAKVAAMETPT
jgi:5-(carboxyamino)imidazole ribonucleotide mutase